MRILVVDDDSLIRSTLLAILCKLGVIDEAENGMEAVHKFQNACTEDKPYNLIIMDYQMPIMDGCDALRNIRTLEKEQMPENTTTVYISSGHTDCKKEFSSRIDLDSNVHFMNKPFNFSKLMNDIISLNTGSCSQQLLKHQSLYCDSSNKFQDN